MARNDTAVLDDAEREWAERLVERCAADRERAERCAELLRTLPAWHASDGDGPWFNYYEEHPGAVLTDLTNFITTYFVWQRGGHRSDTESRWRKDFDDMHKAAVKFAASIRRFGVRKSFPHDNCPDLEAMLASVESMILWMGNNPSKHLLPPWSSDPNKRRSRSFVEWVIFVVEGYTGRAIERDTKGTPTAELKVLQEIVAAEAELGPIKFMAALIGAGDEDVMKWFILAVAMLLDPAAVLLLLASQRSIATSEPKA